MGGASMVSTAVYGRLVRKRASESPHFFNVGIAPEKNQEACVSAPRFLEKSEVVYSAREGDGC